MHSTYVPYLVRVAENNELSLLTRESINTGLDYWNGGIVDWIFLFGFLIIYDVSSL